MPRGPSHARIIKVNLGNKSIALERDALVREFNSEYDDPGGFGGWIEDRLYALIKSDMKPVVEQYQADQRATAEAEAMVKLDEFSPDMIDKYVAARDTNN